MFQLILIYRKELHCVSRYAFLSRRGKTNLTFSKSPSHDQTEFIFRWKIAWCFSIKTHSLDSHRPIILSLKVKYIHKLLNMEYEVISCDTSSHKSCTIKLYGNPTSDGKMFWPNILPTARWIFINYLLSDFVALSPLSFWYRYAFDGYINYAKGKE